MRNIVVLMSLIVLANGCKKDFDEPTSPKPKISDNEIGVHGSYPVSCEMTSVRNYIAGVASNEDVEALNFDSASLYRFAEDALRVYVIPFLGEDPHEKFAIVATDDSNAYQGSL